jgi:DNA adenine methylase
LVFHHNGILDGEYIEPYAGGASVALTLLFGEYVSRVHINDYDRAIYAFWKAVLEDTDVLCAKINDADLTVEEWQRQREVYRNKNSGGVDLAFATFFLNRCNRSGIIKGGGIIGGLNQTGQWKMDARFTKPDLISRIQRIALYRQKIRLTNLDAASLLRDLIASPSRKGLVYLDPPYFDKGSVLYANSYRPEDHAAVFSLVDALRTPWVVSYDDVPQIRALYADYRSISYGLRYTAGERATGAEIMFFSPRLRVPDVPNPSDVSPKMISAHKEIPALQSEASATP